MENLENLEETNEPVETELIAPETEPEGSEDNWRWKKAVDLTSPEPVDWEAAERVEEREKQEEQVVEEKQKEEKKTEEETFLDSLDPVVKIKLKMNYLPHEIEFLRTMARGKGKSIEEVIKDGEIKDIIIGHRRQAIPKVPYVLKPVNENRYLSRHQFKKKLNSK